MSDFQQALIHNRLLRGFDPGDFSALRPHAKLVPLTTRLQLVVPGETIEFAWFVDTGVVSVATESPDGRQIEVGLVGCEGMVDVATVNGADRSPLNSFVQVSGQAWQIPAAALRRAMDASPPLRERLSNFVQTLLVQVSQSALANGVGNIDERLARGLLMSHDRVVGTDIEMTHELLAVMLGVRRAGVTVALQALSNAGLIAAGRGHIEVLDRSGLERYANEIYGVPEAEYDRLFGTLAGADLMRRSSSAV